MANVYRNIGAVVKDTGGLWDRLDDQIAARPAPAAGAGLGLWDMVVTGSVGGVWDQFDHETVLLRREHLERDRERLDLWREAADETLILPRAGLLPVWDAVLARSDAEGGLDLDSTLMMLRPEAESVWQRSADETLMLSRPTESVFAQQVRARDLTTYFPRRKPGYAPRRHLLDSQEPAHGRLPAPDRRAGLPVGADGRPGQRAGYCRRPHAGARQAGYRQPAGPA